MTTNFKIVQSQTFTLAGAGVSAGDSSMTLEDFNQIDGTPLTMSDFGIQGFGTCEPASGINEEEISFTGVVSNIDGTVTLTGISTVLNVYPQTQTPNFATGHAGGTIFVISNTAGFYTNFPAKSNDETITGIWSVPYPTIGAQIANKNYVDAAIVSGGVPASTTVPGIAMEATQAQVDAKTATNTYLGNPYELFVNPSTLRATKYNDYVVATGGTTAYAIAPTPAITAYADGQQFTFLVNATNTGASTLAVNGLSAIPVVLGNSAALTGGELPINSIVTVTYLSGSFLIQSSTNISNITNSTTINTDPTSVSWLTVELDSFSDSLWTGVGSQTRYANGSTANTNGGILIRDANGFGNVALGATPSDQVIKFSLAKTFQFKVFVSAAQGTGTGLTEISSFMGFGISTISNDSGNPANVYERIVFGFYNGAYYAICANGTSVTSVNLGVYTSDVVKAYSIVVNGTTSANFYVNGVLVTTISTNLPTSTGVVHLFFGGLNSPGGGAGPNFVSNVFFSQKTS